MGKLGGWDQQGGALARMVEQGLAWASDRSWGESRCICLLTTSTQDCKQFKQ